MNHKLIKNHKGSSLLSPAHGRIGARAAILSFLPLSAPPPPEKIAEGFQQAGEKEGGWGEGIFARLFCAVGAVGWEAFPPFGIKPNIKAKQFSFFNLIFRATLLLKGFENCFALLAEVRRAETRSGANQAFSVQKRFELRSAIATNIDILKIQRRFVARSPRTKILLSGHWELNPIFTHPKRAYYRYTMPR